MKRVFGLTVAVVSVLISASCTPPSSQPTPAKELRVSNNGIDLGLLVDTNTYYSQSLGKFVAFKTSLGDLNGSPVLVLGLPSFVAYEANNCAGDPYFVYDRYPDDTFRNSVFVVAPNDHWVLKPGAVPITISHRSSWELDPVTLTAKCVTGNVVDKTAIAAQSTSMPLTEPITTPFEYTYG